MSPWPLQGTLVPEITVQQLAEQFRGEKRPFLLDVRQPWEANQASLPDSHLVPLNQVPGEIDELRGLVPDGVPVVVYCHHGMRSQVAAAALLRAGFKNVSSLAGGIDAWSALIDPSVPRY